MRNYKNRWGDLWRMTTNNVKCGMGNGEWGMWNERSLCSYCIVNPTTALISLKGGFLPLHKGGTALIQLAVKLKDFYSFQATFSLLIAIC